MRPQSVPLHLLIPKVSSCNPTHYPPCTGRFLRRPWQSTNMAAVAGSSHQHEWVILWFLHLEVNCQNHIKHLFMWCEHFDSSLNNSAVCCFYLFTDFLKPGDFSGSTEEKIKIWPLAKYKMVDYYNTAVQSQYAHPHSCFPMCFIFWLPHHQYNSETFAAKKQNLTSKKSEIYLRTQ